MGVGGGLKSLYQHLPGEHEIIVTCTDFAIPEKYDIIGMLVIESIFPWSEHAYY